MRTLADLASRCIINEATGCWHWRGAKEQRSGHAPSIWIKGIGATSLQVALPMLALGRRAAPGVRYVPTCGNLHCLNFSHRREGTQQELMTLAAAVYADKRVAAIRAASDRISAGLQASHARRRAMRPKPPQPPKPPKPPGPKLHDKLDRMGRTGVMPSNVAAALRKPGSSARRLEPVVLNRPPAAAPTINDNTRITVAPVCTDQRYTVRELPPGYRSQIDPREARPWAQAAAQGRAA